MIKYIELFAGIGGFRYGIEKASKNFECVYSNEWDKYAAQIYNKNFNRPLQQDDTPRPVGNNNTQNQSLQREYLDSGGVDTRDITTVPTSDIPDCDLLVGGFPCQAFSIAGKRRGFDDTRGTLFFEIARILADKRPRYFILENVKGLLSHDSGKTFQTILGVLTDLGYEYQWQVLNSKNFGVPQNRERVFIIGHLRGTPGFKIFPVRKDSQADIVLPTLTARYWSGQANGGYISNKTKQVNQPKHSNDRAYSDDGISPTLNTMQGGRRQPKIAIPVLTPDRIKKRQNGRRFKNNGEPSFTLTGQDKHGVMTNETQIRRLTPIECERLQGFPDGWTEGLSDTQRYKCLGNAVTTNVITAIIERMI